MTADATAPDEASTTRTAAQRARLRWGVLALLVGVLVAGLTVSALVVFGNGAGPGLGDRVSSVFDPPEDPAESREEVLAAARTFVQRFNSYGPDLLEDDCRMPRYAAVGDLMTAKFRKVFDNNVVIAERTVSETGIDRVATVSGVGISAIDADSATALVSGEVALAYPSEDGSGEPVQLQPQRFRYEVSLVRHQGAWLVDDLDDVDDGLPSFATSSNQEDLGPRGCATPSSTPSPSSSPSSSPSGAATEGSTP